MKIKNQFLKRIKGFLFKNSCIFFFLRMKLMYTQVLDQFWVPFYFLTFCFWLLFDINHTFFRKSQNKKELRIDPKLVCASISSSKKRIYMSFWIKTLQFSWKTEFWSPSKLLCISEMKDAVWLGIVLFCSTYHVEQDYIKDFWRGQFISDIQSRFDVSYQKFTVSLKLNLFFI